MEMSFENGCKITIPDNVTVIFASNEEGSEKAEGVMDGDKVTAANLTLHMFEKIYNELADRHKAQFIHAFVEVIQSNLPKNMQVNSIFVRKGVSPEADDE